jgi:hypothetical protein
VAGDAGQAGSCPTQGARSGRCWSACPTRPTRAGCGSRGGWTTAWCRPGPDDPAPVFVRPELGVEVSFLGWEGARLHHPAYSGLAAHGR